MIRIVLLHGAATTSAIWDGFAELIPGHEIVAVERPRTGDLGRELGFLAPLVKDSWVVGISGGATLGLALAASDVRIAGAVLHEPAVGSLLPELLLPMREAFAAGGTAAFGRTLYGPAWEPSMPGGHGDEVTARELAMFGALEPAPVAAGQGRVIVTFGGDSPPIRHQSVAALHTALGYEVRQVDGLAHFPAGVGLATFAASVGAIVDGRR